MAIRARNVIAVFVVVVIGSSLPVAYRFTARRNLVCAVIQCDGNDHANSKYHFGVNKLD
jgi:hypothetical protein